ncbi:MAG: immunoglobulin domain-containing protein [Phycisphaeraceae bacterium]|nr:immunoglobulin domain-containing protein [Phycisphaerae bacterium]MBX3391530.1 immunoglobulin domain-containing protein [Phycisphaeraceae bacterium]
MRYVRTVVAACAALVSGAAGGQVMFQDLGGLVVTKDFTKVSIDMDLDGIAEVFARYYAECEIMPVQEYASVYFGTAVDMAFIATYSNNYVRGLVAGDVVGPAFMYKPTGCLLYGMDFLCDGVVTYTHGDWKQPGAKYLAVRVEGADGPRYGWILVENQTGSHESFRVLECGLELTPGKPIVAGDRGGCATILTQPQPVTAVAGNSVTLSVVTTGYVTGYRWYRDGVAIGDTERISGSSTRLLRIMNASYEDTGYYSVRATGPCATVVTEEVPVRIDPVCRPAEGFELAVEGGVAVVPDSATLRPTTALTVEMWFNPSKNNTNPVLIAKGARDWCTNHSWLIEYDGQAIFPVPFCIAQVTFSSSAGCKYAFVVTGTGQPERWTHVAMTVETTDIGELKLYVDGVLKSSTTKLSDGTPIKGRTIAPTDWPLSIGRVTQNGVPVAEPFNGRIDDVVIWNKARTAAQVAASFASGHAATTLGSAAAYVFNDTSNPVRDSSGNANHGVLLPGASLEESRVCCPVDVDGSGFADALDFTVFFELYMAGDLRADFDRSGFVDTDDFSMFITAFEAGC